MIAFQLYIARAALAMLALASAVITPGASPQAILRTAAHLSPNAAQLEWQHEEQTAFIHFGPNTFTNREWGTGNENPNVFDPSGLDTDQWAQVLRRAGFKKVILVAKHHDGFVLWPTRYTMHSVKSSRWLGGRGDVVGSFVRSAHKYGLLVGFYLSPADLYQARRGGSFANGSTPRMRTIPTLVTKDYRRPRRFFHFKLDDYNAYYLNELYELLTQYGPVEEIWFDGANPLKDSGRVEPYDFTAWYALVHELQPHAVIFPIDVNWVGNEDGIARLSQWSVIPLTGSPMPDQSTHAVDPGSPQLGSDATLVDPKTRVLRWMPSECDVPLERGWFWHPASPPKSPAELRAIYFQSVGRNCQLLLDVPPDRSGKFDTADVHALNEFGSWISTTFATNLAGNATLRTQLVGGDVAFSLGLSHAKRFSLVALQEDIRFGQRVESFAVEVSGKTGWREIAHGTTIGYKRLLTLQSPATASTLRVRILHSRDVPHVLRIALY